jgi:hypothetical protein
MQHYLIPGTIARISVAILLCLALANITGMVHVEKLTGSVPVFCPFKAITGIDCPGCGMTRAIISLIEGNPGNAFLYNPFSFFLLFILTLSILPLRWFEPVRGRLERMFPIFYAVALSLAITVWIFDRLLPHIFC